MSALLPNVPDTALEEVVVAKATVSCQDEVGGSQDSGDIVRLDIAALNSGHDTESPPMVEEVAFKKLGFRWRYHSHRQYAVITSISKDSPLDSFNKKPDNAKVVWGDRICAVNGKTGDEMNQQLLSFGNDGQGGTLSMRVDRRQDTYRSKTTLLDALQPQENTGVPDTVLIKATWLIKHAEAGLPLPRRQDVPPEAVWNPSDNAGGLRNVLFLAVSYCWLTKNHPDPNGIQLRKIAKLLKRALKTTSRKGCSRAKNRWKEAAVFFDWASLFQGSDKTEEQRAAFKRSLGNINLWYSHYQMHVWCLTDEGAEPVYFHRGWPAFEFLVSQIVKPSGTVLNLALRGKSNCNCWRRHVFSFFPCGWCSFSKDRLDCETGRLPPTGPEETAELIKLKKFTNSADADMVCEKYADVFENAAERQRILDFNDLRWKSAEIQKLAKVLPMYRHLKELHLDRNYIGTDGVNALAALLEADALPHLETLSIVSNNRWANFSRLTSAWLKAGKTGTLSTNNRLFWLSCFLVVFSLGYVSVVAKAILETLEHNSTGVNILCLSCLAVVLYIQFLLFSIMLPSPNLDKRIFERCPES